MSTKNRFGLGGGGGQTYTPAERKGEVNELRALLRDPQVDRDLHKKREVLKKVLAFMTLGLDTSALFTEMILACVSKDLVQKKMVYLYLCVHSEANSELAILAINTLQKDCADESPLVRGLALRSLASLRLPQIAEYLVPVLKVALLDKAPYVRKTAVLACLKLRRVAPETFQQMGLVDKMYGMLRDNDAQVAANALTVLQQALAEEGGVEVTKSVLYYLLNRVREMTEWQQCQVLALVPRYTAATEEEMFDIMNLLEERLLGNNSAVITSCAHVLLHLTQSLPAVHKQVFERLREPLLTLMATAHSNETAYPLLCHLRLLVQREPGVFAGSYKDFFCRLTDPSYMKCTKIDILTTVANDTNAGDIVAELMEYVSDSNAAISKQAVAAMAKVALAVESSARPALDHFLTLLAMDVEHVRGQTLVAMRDYLRKYKTIDTVRPFLTQIVSSYKALAFQDDESKIALAWVLGEFGEHIADAPYLLEAMTSVFSSEPFALRLELLTALMKLFFKRPPEVQPCLARVLTAAMADFSHADVHDRALLYYRLLRGNPQAAAQIICAEKAPIDAFAEDDTSDARDRLFEEFNTASVILGAPHSRYARLQETAAESEGDEEEEEEEESDRDAEGGLLSAGAASSEPPSAAAPVAPGLELDDEAELEPPEFQAKWGQLPVASSATLKLKVVGADALEAEFEDHSLFVLASGQQGTVLKMYVYGVSATASASPPPFLVELQVQATGATSIVMKCPPGAPASAFMAILQKALAKFVA